MSTREIAELTGKQHPHVMRDFAHVCEALEIDPSKFGGVYLAGNGEERPLFNLPKDLTTTLVSGYSIPMRHKIVQRWIELEAKTETAPTLPTSYREAMLLAVERYEQLEVTEFHSKNPRPYLEYSPRSIPPCPPLDFSRITRGGAGLVLG